MNLKNRDLSSIWHPCSQMKDYIENKIPLIPIKSGSGVYIEDFDGNKYIDAVSSWWVNLFGHANPYINSRIKDQLDKLEHVIMAGFTHEPIIELSEKLINITPQGLNKCFYADNGSSAVEAALKMSFHYWKNIGQTNKTKFISIANSYHGETLGALAVGDVGLYKDTYKPLLLEVITAPSPDCFYREPEQSWEDYCILQAEKLEQILAEKHAEVCAVFIEPLVQCAGNMRMHHPIYLKKLRELCDKYKVHLIADEIAVGFGRTGTMFACEQAGISPDLMCLSKGITGGYMTLSVVMTTNQIYDAFYDDYENLTAFLQSHSYTGNALACAAALATLEIFEKDNIIEKNKKLITYIKNKTQDFNNHNNIYEVRQTGMICAIEMIKDKKNRIEYPWQERRGIEVYKHGLKNGVLLRPLGNTIYFMPPYVITEDEIDTLVKVASEGIELAV